MTSEMQVIHALVQVALRLREGEAEKERSGTCGREKALRGLPAVTRLTVYRVS